MLPALERIHAILEANADKRVCLADVFRELRKPPYGVRDGLIPLLLTVFAISKQKDVAFYKDGSFIRDMAGESMLVLTKTPEKFDIQYCRIEGVRAELFQRLLKVLAFEPSQKGKIELWMSSDRFVLSWPNCRPMC